MATEIFTETSEDQHTTRQTPKAEVTLFIFRMGGVIVYKFGLKLATRKNLDDVVCLQFETISVEGFTFTGNIRTYDVLMASLCQTTLARH
jgi:hypothetical protein